MTRPLRVAQMVDSLQMGGKERVAIRLANGLVAHDIESHLIATREEGVQRDQVAADVRFFCAFRRYRWDLPGLAKVRSYLLDHEIDLVHTHDRGSAYLFRLVRATMPRKPLHVVHDHDGPGLGNPRLIRLDGWMLSRADAGVAVSEPLRAQLQQALGLPDDRCLYVANGVALRPEAPRFDGPPTVLQVCNLRWPKGHDTAVRAAARVRETFPGLRWICVGRLDDPPPDYVDGVRALIRELDLDDCVVLHGPDLRATEMMERAHVGVLSSDVEGLPVTLLEYMAARLPVVMTDVGQCGEVVHAAGSGRVVPPRDPEALAHAITALLGDPAESARLGAAGRAWVEANASEDVMVRQLVRLYRELAAREED